MKKKPKYKVVLSDEVKRTLKKLSPKDKKEFAKAIKKISKNPKVGKPIMLEILPTPWEKCSKCMSPMRIIADDKEASFNCPNPDCEDGDGFWVTLKELNRGRYKHMQKMKKEEGAQPYIQ
jgi:hypothetical protein